MLGPKEEELRLNFILIGKIFWNSKKKIYMTSSERENL